VKLRTKIASGLLALASFGGGALALATPAHADYAFPGISMIDSQRTRNGALSSCDEWGSNGDGQVDCYTWLRTNGVARRGSPADYYVEASNGFVYSLCSSAFRFNTSGSTSTSPTNADYFGQAQSPLRWNWVPNSGRSVYCTSPVGAFGTTYYGFSWPDVPNGNSQ